MTAVFLLLASVLLLLLGHLFRILRWEQFIRIYERPMRGAMLRGMAGGYAVNFLLPFHIGDIFRAWFTGRKMKNGPFAETSRTDTPLNSRCALAR